MQRQELEEWCDQRNGEINGNRCQLYGGEVAYYSGGISPGDRERIEVSTSDKFVKAPPSQVATDVRGNLVLLDGTGMDESRESEFRDPEPLSEQDYNASVSGRRLELRPR